MTARTASSPSVTAPEASRPAWRVLTFGREDVLVNGQPATWSAQSARDLFFYLLSHPEGRTRDEILEDLWGVDEGAAGANRFRVTVHRLRASLGAPDAVVERHGRYGLCDDLFRASDVYDLYTAAQAGELATDSTSRLRAYQRVLSLHHGEYLASLQADWARTAREEHRATYVRACVEVSLAHCEQSDCEGAVTALVRALRADPYIGENYHQKLMTCLSVVEGKYAAIEHYRRFLRFLREDLDDTPMPETTDLAERIKCGEQICKRPSGPEVRMTLNCPLTPDGSCPGVLGALLDLN